MASDGWDEDDGERDPSGGLDLSRSGASAGAAGPSAYTGGGIGFGDDDPFADDAPQGSLELDVPSTHNANSARSLPVPDAPAAPGSVPDLPPSQPRPMPPRSDPALSAPPRSDPALSAPPRSDPAPPQSQPSVPRHPSDPALPPDSQPHMPVVPAPVSSSRIAANDPANLIARFPSPPEKVWESPLYTMKVLWRQFELRQDLATLRKRRSPDVTLYERALKMHDPKMFALGLAISCAVLAIASFIFFLPVILRFMHDPS